jgi:small GTP-binding protein
MIQKKICMLGSFAVGKTSLVRRFVENMFSDKYLTTIGVKIEKKIIRFEKEEVTLIVWDIAGENGYHHINSTYMRGMGGYLLVADKTRMSTLNTALEIQAKVQQVYPDIPYILLINKMDLTGQWDIEDSAIEKLKSEGRDIIMTSAKTGQNVEEAFQHLAIKVLEK